MCNISVICTDTHKVICMTETLRETLFVRVMIQGMPQSRDSKVGQAWKGLRKVHSN